MKKLRSILCLGLLAACSTPADQENANALTQHQDKIVLGQCTYINPFSQWDECREYIGSDWNETNAAADCARQRGTFALEQACESEAILGRCSIEANTAKAYDLVFPSSDASRCNLAKTGCEVFAEGSFTASSICSDDGGGSTNPPGANVFRPGTLECVDPLPNEAPGTQDGKVCTRSMISACTEPGRNFADYGECSTVLTQRPYWPAPPAALDGDDVQTRLLDAAYMNEVNWVREQVTACACVCCHSTEAAPETGTSNWFIEAEPIWTDSFYPTGLAMGAGWVDSTALGAYPAADNNGFARDESGIPTTDTARMIRFFENELTRRGFTRADFEDTKPFGGPLVDQLNYEPGDCESGEGVDAQGTITWSGGAARYVYVLADGSANPGVPPNLDLPAGTLWRLDVLPDDAPLSSGIRYGESVAPAVQRYPTEGAPEALQSGERYYLYVLADVGVPITRCLFRYE